MLLGLILICALWTALFTAFSNLVDGNYLIILVVSLSTSNQPIRKFCEVCLLDMTTSHHLHGYLSGLRHCYFSLELLQYPLNWAPCFYICSLAISSQHNSPNALENVSHIMSLLCSASTNGFPFYSEKRSEFLKILKDPTWYSLQTPHNHSDLVF